MFRRLFAAALLVLAAGPALAAGSIPIVAAENFYGEAAAMIGGDRVSVASVIAQPGTDPHDYEPTPSVAAAVADARIVILNGAGYDPWMERLIASGGAGNRIVIDVASLIGRKAGDNPHVWYDPAAMPALANALAAALIAADPDGRSGFEQRPDLWLATLAPIQARIDGLKARYAGTPVTATEPVFGYMAAALGLAMQGEDFQTATMNETEPSASAIAGMERDIRDRRVKVLFYNAQVEDPLSQHLAELAKAAGVPLVAVTETEPPGQTFDQWMLGVLDATAKALGAPAS